MVKYVGCHKVVLKNRNKGTCCSYCPISRGRVMDVDRRIWFDRVGMVVIALIDILQTKPSEVRDGKLQTKFNVMRVFVLL